MLYEMGTMAADNQRQRAALGGSRHPLPGRIGCRCVICVWDRSRAANSKTLLHLQVFLIFVCAGSGFGFATRFVRAIRHQTFLSNVMYEACSMVKLNASPHSTMASNSSSSAHLVGSIALLRVAKRLSCFPPSTGSVWRLFSSALFLRLSLSPLPSFHQPLPQPAAETTVNQKVQHPSQSSPPVSKLTAYGAPNKSQPHREFCAAAAAASAAAVGLDLNIATGSCFVT